MSNAFDMCISGIFYLMCACYMIYVNSLKQFIHRSRGDIQVYMHAYKEEQQTCDPCAHVHHLYTIDLTISNLFFERFVWFSVPGQGMSGKPTTNCTYLIICTLILVMEIYGNHHRRSCEEILEPTACTELIPKSWLCVYSVHALTFWIPDIVKTFVYRSFHHCLLETVHQEQHWV